MSRRQADAALGFSETQVTDITGSDSLKSLGQIRSDARKKNLFKWSRESRPNPLLPSGSDKRGYEMTGELLELAHCATMFATGLKNPLKNRHCFICMTRNAPVKSQSLYELICHFQLDHI